MSEREDWSLRCHCGAVAIAAAPGEEPEFAPGGIMISRGKPTVAWCAWHWPAMRGVQAELFAEPILQS